MLDTCLSICSRMQTWMNGIVPSMSIVKLKVMSRINDRVYYMELGAAYPS